MKLLRRNSRPGRAALAVTAAAGLAAVVFASAPSAGDAPIRHVTATPAAVVATLDQRAFTFADAPLPVSAIPAATAVDRALGHTISKTVTGVYAGLLTARDWHVGDESTPLVLQNRPVFAVHVADSRIPLRNPQARGATVVLDQVAFVDAFTGDVLVTTVL